MGNSKKALIYAGLAVLFWSTVPTAFKIALRTFDPVELIFYSSGVSVAILFILVLVQGKLQQVLKQSKNEALYSVLMGALNPALYYIILFKAYSLLPAQLAQPLNMVWPIVLALFSVFFLGQKTSWISFTGMIISFCGIGVISMQGGFNGIRNTNFTGVGLALFTSVLWAAYWILNVKDKRDEIVKLFLGFCFGFIFLLGFLFLFKTFQIRTLKEYLPVIYIGLFETGITYVLWLKAMQAGNNNAKIGNLVFFAPFISLIFVNLVLKETIFITTFIGLVFLVTGLLVQQLDKKRMN